MVGTGLLGGSQEAGWKGEDRFNVPVGYRRLWLLARRTPEGWHWHGGLDLLGNTMYTGSSTAWVKPRILLHERLRIMWTCPNVILRL